MGMKRLAWSFYGTSDANDGNVNDISTFPLLATLHYLIKSNGCIRVIETGTARGISTGCLASAVCHREGGRVVTIDIGVMEDRQSFWSQLPDHMQRCMEVRTQDSLTGLKEALDRGETYHAALLDTEHTAEHVLKEFELASQLVCSGGLILIHDATLRTGSVGSALNEIQNKGYGVVRLWTADSGVQEDDGLGLALVENRRINQ
jgi:predicted O-methyltransferase YrrM